MALADYIYKKPSIITGRLTIRPLLPSDIPALKEWMPDKNLYRYWGKKPGKTDKCPELMFEKAEKPSKSFHLGIVLNKNNKAIGELWVYLIEDDRMASVAIRISAAYQGMGYGTEALSAMAKFCFENTELKRLQAMADIRNAASCRMLEKCGFVREGLIRQGKMVNSWCDYCIYGMLDSDYSSRK